MKPEKAIEILEDITKGFWPTPNIDAVPAIKLGIEALKRLVHCRKWSYYAVKEPLTGETIGRDNP